MLNGKVWGGAAGFAGELHYLPIEHNLEYAQNHFAGADISDYFTKVICGCAALINPDRVVLYADSRLTDKAARIRESCAQALPEQAMPTIELSQSFEQDYTRGLFTLAKKMEETT